MSGGSDGGMYAMTTLQDGTNTFTAIYQGSTGNSTSTVTAYLPTNAVFQHDLNGNLTSDSLRTFYYDDENQLTNVTVVGAWKSEFAYDGRQRRRIRREYSWQNSAWVLTNEVRYVYDGNLVIQERNVFNLPMVTYTRGPDLSGGLEGAGGIGGLLARTDHCTVPTTHTYYFTDGKGNVVALLNERQQVVAQYFYEPYGRAFSLGGPMAEANTYRFSSKEIHVNSGLYYYGLRYYDPSFQRWITRDPQGIAGGLNLYAFCGNDPVNNVDAYGRFTLVDLRALESRLELLGGMLLPGLQRACRDAVSNPGSVSRSLTEGEIALSKTIFGTNVDYATVHIIRKKWRCFQRKDTIITPDGNLYVNPKGTSYSTDYSSVKVEDVTLLETEAWFIHEMTHVWQYQHGVNVVANEIYTRSTYNFSKLGSIDFKRYGIEQQAEIVSDYFRVLNGLEYKPGISVPLAPLEDYQKLLAPVFP